jgi:hypothetical protein
MFQNGRRFSVWFAVGATILVIGLVLQWYPAAVINGMNTRLSQLPMNATNQDEINKLQGAKSSWDVWQVTTFQPLSSVLFAAGIIIIVYSVIQGIFTVASGFKVARKQEKSS